MDKSRGATVLPSQANPAILHGHCRTQSTAGAKNTFHRVGYLPLREGGDADVGVDRDHQKHNDAGNGRQAQNFADPFQQAGIGLAFQQAQPEDAVCQQVSDGNKRRSQLQHHVPNIDRGPIIRHRNAQSRNECESDHRR